MVQNFDWQPEAAFRYCNKCNQMWFAEQVMVGIAGDHNKWESDWTSWFPTCFPPLLMPSRISRCCPEPLHCHPIGKASFISLPLQFLKERHTWGESPSRKILRSHSISLHLLCSERGKDSKNLTKLIQYIPSRGLTHQSKHGSLAMFLLFQVCKPPWVFASRKSKTFTESFVGFHIWRANKWVKGYVNLTGLSCHYS